MGISLKENKLQLDSHIGAGGTAHSPATTALAGFMSAIDKTKLDGISAGANKTTSSVNGSIKVDGVDTVVYAHPTGDGNLHVPATGTGNNNNVLKAGTTAGSVSWGSVAFSELSGKPTTLAGYGITDAALATHNHDATYLKLAGGIMTGALTLQADPASALQAATKQYVDSVASGLDVKPSVRVIATTNVVLSGLQTIDNITLVAGNRILVAGQTSASQNGLYIVNTGAWTRTTDVIKAGAFTFVEEGVLNADTGWVVSTNGAIVIGTTPINLTQFSAAGIVTGDGLTITKTGNTLSLPTGVVTTGTYTKVTVDTYGRVTGGTAMVAGDVPNLDWSKITSGKPTTLAGYGITDAVLSSDVVTVATANKILKLDASGNLPTSVTGNAGTATKLQTGRTIGTSGDVTATAVTFDGTANITLSTVLANSGVTAGSYPKVTVDAKGRVTGGTTLVAADIPVLDWSKITTGRPTTLAGYGITDASLSKLTDTNVASPLVNQILMFTGNSKWSNVTLDSGMIPIDSRNQAKPASASSVDEWLTSLENTKASRLEQLQDVSAGDPQLGDVLIYNDLSKLYVSRQMSAGDIPNLPWTKITSGKPTTLAGYGITDAAPSSHVGSGGVAHAAVTSGAAGFMTAGDKVKLDGIAVGAQVNQNGFANIKVGATTVAAKTTTDTVELVAGSGIILTPDAATNKVTVAATNVVSASDIAKGKANFAGDLSVATIAHGLGVIPTVVMITPSADPAGYLGEYWYTADATNIKVYNSGSAVTQFAWIAYK